MKRVFRVFLTIFSWFLKIFGAVCVAIGIAIATGLLSSAWNPYPFSSHLDVYSPYRREFWGIVFLVSLLIPITCGLVAWATSAFIDLWLLTVRKFEAIEAMVEQTKRAGSSSP